VRASAVVQVVIDGDTITVDGVVLPPGATSGRTPYDVALATLASSATRRRPVRAEITESFGVTRCLVLPDATTRELTFTYTGGVDADAVETAHAQSEPAVRFVPARPAAEAARQVAQQVARQRAVRPAWLSPARVVLAAVAVVGGVVALVWALAGLGSDPEGVDGELTAAAAMPTGHVKPTASTAPGHTFAPLPRLHVTATGGAGSIEFRGERADIRLRLRGPVDRDQRRQLTQGGFLIEDLPPGTYRWRVTALGHVKATGSVVVLARPTAPTSTPASTPQPQSSTQSPATQETFAPPVDPDRN